MMEKLMVVRSLTTHTKPFNILVPACPEKWLLIECSSSISSSSSSSSSSNNNNNNNNTGTTAVVVLLVVL